MRWLALVLLLAGCASASPARPAHPYTTPEIDAERLECLTAGGLWMETQERYQCRPITKDPRA